MRLLVALTYYRPHVSGLSIYVERLARALARRGHRVTVLTSQYARTLPARESLDGVTIIRAPVVARISKGVVMPTIGFLATALVRGHDALSLHLPQLDAAGIALRGRLFRKPTVLTYHSDLILPPSPLNWTANRVVDAANHLAATFSHAISAYTEDFARNSPFLSRYRSKVRVIPPPVELPPVPDEAVRDFVQSQRLNGHRVVGIAARLAAEKGIEYLLEALPYILEKHPHLRILHVGPTETVIGEQAYARKLAPLFEKHRAHWTFLGTLDPAQMAVFFRACDVTVLPSVNSTETFGMVQIESMLSGTPVVASDLPGVRAPTRLTGMGRTVPVRDARALAEAVNEVLAHRERYVCPREGIAAQFSPAAVAERYEALFAELGLRRAGARLL